MDDDLVRGFLEQVGAAGDKASLVEVGQALGLDRGQAEELSMNLMGDGLLEMVSLSGAVRLTEAGRMAAGGAAGSGGAGEDMAALVADIAAAGDLGLDQAAASDLSLDLTALSAQLRRAKPLSVVVNALLDAVASGLAGSPEAQARALGMRLKAARG